MGDKHPYVSGSGSLLQLMNHLRKSFPPAVTADTLKKLGLAPNNESYIINILRFIGIIDEEGKKTEAAAKVFSQHDEAAFQKAFASLVEEAYSDLFSLHGEDAWKLDLDALIQYFRSADGTSELVGHRQATTFQALSALSGHGEAPQTKTPAAKKTPPSKPPTKKAPEKKGVATSGGEQPSGKSSVAHAERPNCFIGLTVRIEVNLPTDGDQETYDRIFRSIRENLIDGQ